jgi:type IV secretory pathway TraG/TraD family ATPase VirD4
MVDRNTGKKISKYLGKIYSMRQKRNRIYHIDLDGNGGKRVHKEIMKLLE